MEGHCGKGKPMISKILVPLSIGDGETSSEALELANELAKAHGASVTLLHVVESTPGYVATHLPANFRETAVNVSKEAMQKAASAHGLAGKAEIVVREGNPATEILEFANEGGSDMIVIASHDPGLADYLFGSTAARVVRHAHCSVLVVRHARR